jgi:Rnl2 family RNA ligase
MSKFTKYRSIENVHRQKFINFLELQGFMHPSILYQVTEKIHGANFQFYIDHSGIKMGKRSSFLSDSENVSFFGAYKQLEKYRDSLNALYKYYLQAFPEFFTSITVYGELFGGTYPHPDVPKLDHASKVQAGLFYTNDNDFATIDIVIECYRPSNNPDEDPIIYRQYINQNEVERVCKLVGLMHAPVLGTDLTFKEAMAVQNDSISELYKRYDLPALPITKAVHPTKGWSTDNIIEGTVIKPVEPAFLRSGERIILKNKNAKWLESGTSSNKSNRQIPKAATKMTELQKDVFSNLMRHITENRLRNVMSKFGPVGQKQFGPLLGAMSKDVIEDHIKEDSPNVTDIEEKKERTVLTKMMNEEIKNLIRPNFTNIIDGEF